MDGQEIRNLAAYGAAMVVRFVVLLVAVVFAARIAVRGWHGAAPDSLT